MRRMFDGINADANVIRGAWQAGDLVAYYIAGNSYVWTSQQLALFPSSALVAITLTATHEADVLDVERGGASPADTRGWIISMKNMGYHRPTIYCSRLTIPAVRQATGSFILGQDYDIWAADWTGTPHLVMALPEAGGASAPCAATQYETTPHYDLSVVYDDLWPRRNAPAPPPVLPGPTKAEAQAALAVLSKYVGA